jgi:hypothetical protein
MKVQKVLIGLLAITFMSMNAISANLIEEIDKLSPEEALLVQTKLQAKMLQPIPEWIITNAGGGGGFSVHRAELKDFNTAFSANNSSIKTLYGGSGGFRLPVNDALKIGLEFGGAGGCDSNKSGNTYYDLAIGYGFGLLALDYTLLKTPQLSLNFNGGVGAMTGGYYYGESAEAAGTEYSVHRNGNGLCYKVGLNGKYKLNPIWDIGAGASYFYGKITDLKRADVTDAGAPDLDYSGLMVQVFSTINL